MHVLMCVCVCVFIVQTLTMLNVLCNTLCATVWIYYIFHDEGNVSWPCKMLREFWIVLLFFIFFPLLVCAQVGIGFGAGSFWPTHRGYTTCATAMWMTTHTHIPPQGWDCPTVSLYTAAFGIPSTADRVYWHSCLIACSIVHSERATPPSCPPTRPHPQSLYVSLLLPHSSEHQSHYPHSHTENGNG